MTQRAEIDRLINRLRELEDRVSDLEDGGRGEDAIGFGVEPDGEDFDEDDSEYRASFVDKCGIRWYGPPQASFSDYDEIDLPSGFHTVKFAGKTYYEHRQAAQ